MIGTYFSSKWQVKILARTINRVFVGWEEIQRRLQGLSLPRPRETKDERPWLMLVTCGLSSIAPSGVDKGEALGTKWEGITFVACDHAWVLFYCNQPSYVGWVFSCSAGNLAFSQTGSQFVYACAIDLRTRARKGEEKPWMQTTVPTVIFACEGFSGQLTT